GLRDRGAALLGVEQGRLAGMGANREHEPIGEPGGLAHEVEMAIGDGIKRPRKKRGPRHEGGLARALGSRKVVRTAIGAGGRHRAGAVGAATALVKQFANCCCPSDSCTFCRIRIVSLLPSRLAEELPARSWRPASSATGS